MCYDRKKQCKLSREEGGVGRRTLWVRGCDVELIFTHVLPLHPHCGRSGGGDCFSNAAAEVIQFLTVWVPGLFCQRMWKNDHSNMPQHVHALSSKLEHKCVHGIYVEVVVKCCSSAMPFITTCNDFVVTSLLLTFWKTFFPLSVFRACRQLPSPATSGLKRLHWTGKLRVRRGLTMWGLLSSGSMNHWTTCWRS